MLMRTMVWSALAVVVCAAQAALAADSEGAAEFRAAKTGLQQQLRGRNPDGRIAALKKLAEYPVADAAKLALGVATKDEAAEVREAAWRTVSTLSENPAAAKLLSDTLEKQLKRKEPDETTAPLFGALVASPSEQVADGAIALLDKSIETSAGVRLVAVELADQLGARGQVEDVELLVKLAGTKAFAKQFGFRRSVVWALAHIDTKPAIGALIGLVGQIDGEAQADAIKYLTSVTNQALGNNQEAWAKWWSENGSTFSIPSPGTRTLAAADKVSPGVTTYYGLPVYARRIVFVIDTSRSMSGPRIVAAKRELIAAIDRLRDKDQFTVLAFDNDVRMWQKKLVPADPQAKKRAGLFVNKQDLHPQTASYDALEAAMQFDAEAIFFLTDGAPFGGKVSMPVQIVELITAMNVSRRESIYTIGIGPGLPNSPMEVFLRTLADKNNGVYRRVDE